MKHPILKFLFLSLVFTFVGCDSTKEKNSCNQPTWNAPRGDTPRLGDSEGNFQRIYGKPLSVSKNGYYSYSDNKFAIQVHFANGKAEYISYTTNKGQNLDDYWVSRILSLNSEGRAWVIKRDSKLDDVWCRPADCKLIANIYKNNTLLICTRQFRQWLWNRSGKGKLPPEQPKASIFYPDCASVFLGDSDSKMTDLLGFPSVSVKNANVRYYHDANVEVHAQFANGKCEAIKYLCKKGRLSDHWVTATLALNSNQIAWIADVAIRDGERRFVTIDGKLHGLLKKNSCELILYTELLNKKTINRLNEKNTLIRQSLEAKVEKMPSF
jgi:hypothetical protein